MAGYEDHIQDKVTKEVLLKDIEVLKSALSVRNWRGCEKGSSHTMKYSHQGMRFFLQRNTKGAEEDAKKTQGPVMPNCTTRERGEAAGGFGEETSGAQFVTETAAVCQRYASARGLQEGRMKEPLND